ncbi:MAG: (d)CMP kinase [Chlamydiae bacterium]|nr:(d)CMP kinase [Chlamydiota bacterium]
MIITIDGPAGTGKTTIAKKIAEKLHLPYFDTGAMYRSFTWLVLARNVQPIDSPELQSLLREFNFDTKIDKSGIFYFVNGKDVTKEIRTQKVDAIVSQVAALPVVRESLLKIQKKFGENGNGVFEGRDLGSVVFPEAELKIFLTASLKVRAQRRLDEIQEKRPEDGKGLDTEKMAKEIMRRDEMDSSREIAPLSRPKGAIVIDTSNLTIEQVTERIAHYYQRKLSKMKLGWLYNREMRLFYRAVLFFTWCIYKTCYRCKIFGLEHFFKGAGVIAANHTSYLDPPLVAISWPDEIHFLARKSLFKSFLGFIIERLNSHPISSDPNDVSILKMIIRLLNEKKKVVLFPEGTRSETGELGEIKPGISLLISKTNSALIPTYIHGTYEVWNRKRKYPKLFGKIACVFGTPLRWSSFAHLEKREAQEQLAKSLSEAIKNLKKWYLDGARGTPP